jgi:hypothetical protein
MLSMYIPTRYLLALALVGAVVFGFLSHVVADQLAPARSGTRQGSSPGAVVDQPVIAGTSFAVPSAPPGGPGAAPIVTQPGGAGSTTNIYLTIVNTPAGAGAVPPSVNVVPGP